MLFKPWPYGKGELDNKSVVNALKEIGYQGFLSVELEVEDKENVSRYMGEAKKYLEGML
jgi:sugar phosphate isomerase/epimerase